MSSVDIEARMSISDGSGVDWDERCPHCQSTLLWERTKTAPPCSHSEVDDPSTPMHEIADYYCKACQTPVDDPLDAQEDL